MKDNLGTVLKQINNLEKKSSDICLSQEVIHGLAEQQKAGEKCNLDLATIDTAYQTLLKERINTHAWNNPGIIALGCTFSFALGAIFIASQCFGICR